MFCILSKISSSLVINREVGRQQLPTFVSLTIILSGCPKDQQPGRFLYQLSNIVQFCPLAFFPSSNHYGIVDVNRLPSWTVFFQIRNNLSFSESAKLDITFVYRTLNYINPPSLKCKSAKVIFN